MDDKRLLDVRDLKVRFGTAEGVVRAVNGISFHIDQGEVLAIVGESGSGKSVTCLAIMRLIPRLRGNTIAGQINWRGNDGKVRDLLRLSDAQMRRIRGNDVAMIFQEPMSSLNPVYTIGTQISEAIRLHQGKGRREAAPLALEMLDLLGIPNPKKCLSNYPHQLSGGMRQRAMIAMALSCNPRLLIADEPTTALDVTIQAQILELIKRLQKETAMAILFITHDLGVVAEIADRTMVMYAGRAMEAGAVTAIFGEPRMPYTMGLLNSIPRLGTAREGDRRIEAIPGHVPSALALPEGCAFHPRCKFFAEGICDTEVPPLESCGKDHFVRCVRWLEIQKQLAQ